MKFKFDPVRLIGGVLALMFLIRGDTHAALWALWVATMFGVELGRGPDA